MARRVLVTGASRGIGLELARGGPTAPLGPADTVPSLMRVIDALTRADSGLFFNWDGRPVPW